MPGQKGARGTQYPAGSRRAPLPGEDSLVGTSARYPSSSNLLSLVGKNPEIPSPGHGGAAGSRVGSQVRVPTWEALARAPPQLRHGSGLPAGTIPPQSGHIIVPHLPLRQGHRQPSPRCPQSASPRAGRKRSVITGCRTRSHRLRHRPPQAGH